MSIHNEPRESRHIRFTPLVPADLSRIQRDLNTSKTGMWPHLLAEQYDITATHAAQLIKAHQK